jgi:hypothetical protein
MLAIFGSSFFLSSIVSLLIIKGFSFVYLWMGLNTTLIRLMSRSSSGAYFSGEYFSGWAFSGEIFKGIGLVFFSSVAGYLAALTSVTG